MPIRKLTVLLVFCCALGVAIPLAVYKVVGPQLAAPAPTAVAETLVSSEQVGTGSGQTDVVSLAPAIPPQPQDATPEKPLTMLGVVWMTERTEIKDRSGAVARTIVTPRGLRVMLSDGRTLTERDGVIASVDAHGVNFKDGSRVWSVVKRPATGLPAAPVGLPVQPAIAKPANGPVNGTTAMAELGSAREAPAERP